MEASLSSRFKAAKEIPPANGRRGKGPRNSGATLDVAIYIMRWDKEPDDPEDRIRVIECVDDNEAVWVYQTCQNASHCSMVNRGARFVYGACKRGLLVFLMKRFKRPKFQVRR